MTPASGHLDDLLLLLRQASSSDRAFALAVAAKCVEIAEMAERSTRPIGAASAIRHVFELSYGAADGSPEEQER